MNTNAISQTVKAASIEELEQMVALAQSEIEERRRKRREEAMAEIRRIAGTEHIAVRFDARPKPKKAGKAPVYQGGRHYRHPSKPDLIWNAKGQKPNWLRELEAEGRRAVELPPEPVNDNAPPPVKKTG